MEDNEVYQEINSEDIHEIINTVPSWIIRYGILIILGIVTCLLVMASIIDYPDIIKTDLIINSLNSPKSVLSKLNGKIINLLVADGQRVKQGQALAYLESTGNHNDVIELNKKLRIFLEEIVNKKPRIDIPNKYNLGELQGSYQNFYQQYLRYVSTQSHGYYQEKKEFLKRELGNVNDYKRQILKQQKIQQLTYLNQEQEYNAFKVLYKNKVISRSEFILQENKFYDAKNTLQQSEVSILNSSRDYSSKEKELLDLAHTIEEEQSNFIQALNKCISDSDDWVSKYILSSPLSGKLNYAGIVQQNQNIAINQEVFVINPENTDFFGEIRVPQYNMGKIHIGERALVKLKSYPHEQYGMIIGKVDYISEVAYRDSVFLAKIKFDQSENKSNKLKIVMKNGMQASAEIITEESSLLHRFFSGIVKLINERH